MPREKKAQIIDQLTEVFTKSNYIILTDYRGLAAGEINDLRRRLTEAQAQYRVVKNSLARFAAERAGRDELVSSFEGPVAIAFGNGDITEPAKVLTDFIRTTRSPLSIKGGLLGTRRLTADNVEALATLPSREVLISQIIGGMNSPLTRLATLLASPLRGVMGVLQARITQLEAG